MPEESDTQRLRAIQDHRVRRERDEAEQASDDDERQTHERRADKAAYLRDKLNEQAQAPDE